MRDHEAEVRSEGVANIGIISKYCSEEVLLNKIIPIIQDQIAKDPSQHVRGSLAQSICMLAENMTNDHVIEHLLPPIQEMMKDGSTEVRVSLLENIHNLVKSLSEENLI